LLQEIENSILIMPKLCKLLADLDPKQQFEFAFVVQESIQFSGSKPSDQLGHFKTIIQLLQQYLTLLLIRPETGPTPDDIVEAVQSLAILAAINETNHFIPFNEFYNETVEEMLDLKEDFPKWKSKEGFSYCNYPFLLSTVSKGDILRIDGMIQMR
jgi:ubiquitin-protein ligase E3 A